MLYRESQDNAKETQQLKINHQSVFHRFVISLIAGSRRRSRSQRNILIIQIIH